VESLPVACTLQQADAATRSRRWQALNERAEPRAELVPGRLELRYQPGVGVQQELLELAAAERECCPFVTWEVVAEGAGPAVRVTGEPDGVRAVAAMFGVADPAQPSAPR
jgi:hypothetical protein